MRTTTVCVLSSPSFAKRYASISSGFTGSLSIKNSLFSVTDKVINCLLVCSVDSALGNVILITLGFAKVEIMIKNNNRKNMMSLNDDVATSALKRLFLFIAIWTLYYVNEF